MNKYGNWQRTAGENLAYNGNAVKDPASIVTQLVIDTGVPSKGHRKNIFSTAFTIMGAAVGNHKQYSKMVCEDFAGGFSSSGSAQPAKVNAANPARSAAAKSAGCDGVVKVTRNGNMVTTRCTNFSGGWSQRTAYSPQMLMVLL